MNKVPKYYETRRVAKLWEFDGLTLDEVKKFFDEAFKGAPEGAKLDTQTLDYDDTESLVLSWERPEKPEERERRLRAEETSAEWRRRQYEALKKEFGNG